MGETAVHSDPATQPAPPHRPRLSRQTFYRRYSEFRELQVPPRAHTRARAPPLSCGGAQSILSRDCGVEHQLPERRLVGDNFEPVRRGWRRQGGRGGG